MADRRLWANRVDHCIVKALRISLLRRIVMIFSLATATEGAVTASKNKLLGDDTVWLETMI